MERLNIGCGHDVRAGWINLDLAPLPGVDVIHNLNAPPLPFDDERFDLIDCQDVLEHIELVPVLRDLHRVTRTGGRIRIRCPHFTSHVVYIDPTHRRSFSIETFAFFVRAVGFEREYYFDFHFTAIEEPHITFHLRRSEPWNWIMEPLVNSSQWLQRYFEATALSRFFPALNVELVLVK